MGGFPPIRLLRRFLRTPEEGARTPVFLATSPAVAGITGKYWIDCKEAQPAAAALDDEAAARLWLWSERMTGIADAATPPA
jgi:hypothetical protein